jgi:tetratricopeptide (TPR) repeat protein
MMDYAEQLEELLSQVALDREFGDAYARDKELADANGFYDDAIRKIDQFFEAAVVAEWEIVESDLAELHGVKGGLLKRRDKLDEALESYSLGAEAERDGKLASTYNRLNAIRLALLLGSQTLSSIQEQLRDAEKSLGERLKADQEAADNGWLWADLGDLRLLQSDEKGAEEAYRVFVSKATSGSPDVSLGTLHRVQAALEKRGDPAAGQLKRAVARVTPLLGG